MLGQTHISTEMVKEIHIILDDGDYRDLSEKKAARGMTWREVLHKALDLPHEPDSTQKTG